MAKACVMVSWSDVPHLSEDQKREALSGIPPWQREARVHGTPSLGAGAIYPLDESDILVEPFVIPAHWPRSYGLDVGWNRTAAIWFAWDVDNGGVVAYEEYYRGTAEPASHAAAIKAKGGDWMPGVIDPASKGTRGLKGEVLLDVYRALGLHLTLANNAVEAGLVQTWHMLAISQFKIFRTLTNTRNEMRLYRRNEKGEIVKENDHLMDALRYNIMSGRAVARLKPFDTVEGKQWFSWQPAEVWSG